MRRRWIVSIVLAAVLLLVACGAGGKEKVVTIDSSTYAGYPAVWFSPSTGEIRPVGDSEDPPEAKWEFWVEPRDPEFGWFGSGDYETNGIQKIGEGVGVFESTSSVPRSGYGEGYAGFETHDVNVIRTPSGDCVILMLGYSQAGDGYLQFRWKKLP
jgi:hypothetical protein